MSSPPLEGRFDQSPGVWRTVTWEGEVDLALAPTMLARTVNTVPGSSGLVVDLGLVDFMGAAGLGALVSARSLLRDKGRELLVRHPPPIVQWMLTRFDLADLVEPVPQGVSSTPALRAAYQPTTPQPGGQQTRTNQESDPGE